ncbi:MAG: glyoxalase/bleomycin resistance/dioxygenase family protein [Candidatus Marinimicrobia bacterium]|nr:glyoxalase/bleomycin resistance/dioxygenase family protein [Candidatus Neomarinimicrobiota bacterium]MCF7840253.1 glyoxalase/bleomycin resistance/dioxygenase family protein [Candidatus Neomarinimicrobiota bacterium]MCF7902626.1 glyoxalase/bleomycin resistance/dioxygenase family protein [Candidatus Neomarinimicrobiota bacterium]
MTILYVANQPVSCDFYENILRQKPILNVPGMTEFQLTPTHSLGLMPNDGIACILGKTVPHPSTGNGIPRCELYLFVKNLSEWYKNAMHHGAKLVSPIERQDWGDRVAYFADPDGHIIAFAEPVSSGD